MGLVRDYLFWVRSWPWDEIRSVFELLLYFLGILAVLGCLMRLGMIRKIIREFQDARSPIWDLRKTVSDLKELEPVILALSEQMSLVDEKVDAARKQVAELQVEATSTRTDGAAGVFAVGPEAVAPAAGLRAEDEDPNWLALRDYWRRNTQRLEYVIEHQISDGRRRVPFDRLPRTNYERIINRLQGQGFITAASANASRSLNDIFNKYRPRSRKVPDEVIGGLKALDQQLDNELVPFAKVEAAEAADDRPAAPPPTAAPTSIGQSNQGNGQSPATNFPGQSQN